MITSYRIIFLAFLLSISTNIHGQDSTVTNDTTKHKMFDWFAYPFVFYTPETNLAFGIGGITYFRTSHRKFTRPSKVTALAHYSINNQYLFSITPVVYLDENRTEVSAEMYLENAIDEYYGIGSNSPDIQNPNYLFRNYSINAKYKREFLMNLKFTLIYELMNYQITDTKKNPFFYNDATFGSDGGITSGLGYGATFDDRDNVFYPSSGSLIEFYALHFASEFGSVYDFNRYIFNLRHYHAIMKDDNIIAIQGYAALAHGTPPFYALPKLGGEKMMRGYYKGRYRDRNYLIAQIEYRKKLFWKINGILFLGLGDVGNNFSDFGLASLKYSYGGGVRYILDESEKINIRIDIGFGKDTMGFYFGVEEAF